MGVLNNLWGTMRRSRSGSFRDGSSRRGRRNGSGKSGQDEPSSKGDSSTHSALFDLELSSRGRGGGAADLLARLNSTVHDEGSVQGSADPSVRLPQGLLQRVIYLGRPVMEFELDLLQDVRALRSTCQLQPDGQLDLSCMVEQLQDMGYACYLKHNNPADPGHRHNVQPSCLEKLRHEFIMVAGRSDGSLSHWCLVDPRFREQFAIAQPTPAYDRLLRAVPLEFVGTPLRLQALVETLCAEMAEAFAAQQRTLPPWRKFKSMLSKWFDPEEMPAPQPPAAAPPPAPQLPSPPAAVAQVQLQAAAGPPLSPFEAVQAAAAAAAAAAGAGGLQLRESPAPGAQPQPSLLQQQAAAALAERQSSGGGSQDFFETLEMHKESMRLQQQAATATSAAAAQRPSLPRVQQQQLARQGLPSGVMQQQGAPAALSSENLWQLDASYYGGSGSEAGHRQQQGECSNKPRRRRMPPAGLALATGSQHHHHHAAAALWDEEDELPAGLVALGGAHMAQAQIHASGSWSELSTIPETRSNASSPATAALMAASNAQLGTSSASRRSVGSCMAAAAAAAAGCSQRRSPGGRLDQLYPPPSSAAGSSVCDVRQVAQPSPGTSLVGFAAPPLARSSLAKSSAAVSSAQPPSSSSEGGSRSGNSSPLVPLPAAGPHSGAAAPEGSARGGKKKVVSLLAKGLKSVSQKHTWANLLPTVNTVRRVGPNGPTTQRTWSLRGGSEDGSSRRGRKAAAAAAPLQPAQQPPLYPRHV